MKQYPKEPPDTPSDGRCEEIGRYMLQNGTTVRDAARYFGISKSTVHKDVTEKLARVNLGLYQEVRELLEKNKMERHIRGGLATREKYKRKFNIT